MSVRGSPRHRDQEAGEDLATSVTVLVLPLTGRRWPSITTQQELQVVLAVEHRLQLALDQALLL